MQSEWQCWQLVEDLADVNLKEAGVFIVGTWLMRTWRTSLGSNTLKGLIATTTWAIWKARCDRVFNNKVADPQQIFYQARKSTIEYARTKRNNYRELFSTFNHRHYFSVMCDASWTDEHHLCGLGFIVVAGNQQIVMAGAMAAKAQSNLEAEVAAIGAALETCR